MTFTVAAVLLTLPVFSTQEPVIMVSLFGPLTATLLAALLFGERLGTAGVAGAVLLVAVITLLCGGDRAERSSA